MERPQEHGRFRAALPRFPQGSPCRKSLSLSPGAVFQVYSTHKSPAFLRHTTGRRHRKGATQETRDAANAALSAGLKREESSRFPALARRNLAWMTRRSSLGQTLLVRVFPACGGRLPWEPQKYSITGGVFPRLENDRADEGSRRTLGTRAWRGSRPGRLRGSAKALAGRCYARTFTITTVTSSWRG